MELMPILATLRRNKVGALLIALQIAVTLGILCNGLFIIAQRIALIHRPSGTDEGAIIVIENQWVGGSGNLAARVGRDLDALRSLPGVVDAYVTNSTPLSGSGWTDGVALAPNQQHDTARAALYMADTHGLNTLGLKLIAGRNFRADEIQDLPMGEIVKPTGVIITRALARQLFAHGDAVGRSIYLEFQRSQLPVVGVVDRLQVPWVSSGGWGSTFNADSMIEPFRFLSTDNSRYVVRAAPGALAEVMKTAQRKLFDVDRGRVISKVQSLADARREVYRDDRGLAVILAIVCAMLLVVTGFGIVGLTSYWVGQRHRQIGIRRALGATRPAIVRYFQTENLIIAGAGAALGLVLALAANLWMVTSFEMPRMHAGYAAAGAVLVLLLGQAAVLWPALRAASVPPAVATRGL